MQQNQVQNFPKQGVQMPESNILDEERRTENSSYPSLTPYIYTLFMPRLDPEEEKRLDDRVIELIDQGYTHKEIGADIRRSHTAVWDRIHKLMREKRLPREKNDLWRKKTRARRSAATKKVRLENGGNSKTPRKAEGRQK